MNIIRILILSLLSHAHCQVVQNTFTRDRNTDLTEAFKTGGLLVLATASTQADCYISCLAMCSSNASCMAVTFSYVDQTCTFYNRTFCFGNQTVPTPSVDLYGKKLGLFQTKLCFLTKTKGLKPFLSTENCTECGTCGRYTLESQLMVNNGKNSFVSANRSIGVDLGS
jgi:hypothetical protein